MDNGIQQKVSILGCGWLGFSLAKRLLHDGFHVNGSTTSVNKLKELEDAGIKAYQLAYQPAQKADPQDFFNADILFLNIPFSRQLKDPFIYLQQIAAVINDSRRGTIRFLIFAGTTGIYDEGMGEAREDAPLLLRTDRQQVLHQVEERLRQEKKFKTTVLRFGGLVGPDRPVGKFLAGKKDLPDPNQRVNLIHRDDCVEIVTLIIKKNIQGEILNAVCDGHPTREALYTKAARELNLPPPEFLTDQKTTPYKIVSNRRLKERLGYSFLHPDPMKF